MLECLLTALYRKWTNEKFLEIDSRVLLQQEHYNAIQSEFLKGVERKKRGKVVSLERSLPRGLEKKQDREYEEGDV